MASCKLLPVFHLAVGVGLGPDAWPDPVGDREHADGAAAVDFEGLLELLELHLGLPGVPSRWFRIARMLRRTRNLEGFWSASRERDPLGVAQWMLDTLDALTLHGWRGEADTKKLGELSRAFALIDDSPGHRLGRVRERLARRSLPWELTIHDPIASLPRGWRETLGALAASGASVRAAHEQVDSLPAQICWLRSSSVRAAAHEIALWLAERDDLRETVFVTPGTALDEALLLRSLPTCGARETADPWREAVAVTLAFAHGPTAPHAVMAWLSMRPAMVPEVAARRLRAALAEWPSLQNSSWREALDRAVSLGEMSADERADLDATLEPDALRPSGCPVERLHARVRRVDRWLAAHDVDGAGRGPRTARSACAGLRALLDEFGEPTLSAPIWQKLVSAALASGRRAPRHRAEAGVASVSDPAAVLGSARVVVWWRFTDRDRERSDTMPSLTAVDMRALASHGVTLPDPAITGQARARRAWRPVAAAREQLILVTPRVDDDGTDAAPHPALDVLRARLGHQGRGVLDASESLPRSHSAERPPDASRPRPRRLWSSAPITHRLKESPAGLAAKLACPLRWTLRYHARLPDGDAAVPPFATLAGRVGHALVSELLLAGEHASDLPADAMRAAFDSRAPSMVGAWFAPGADGQRRRARGALAVAFAALSALLRGGGLRVLASEVALSERSGAFGPELEGRPDLVVGDPPRVIDLKWAEGRHGLALARGTALQLATYAHLWQSARGAAALPAVGYFILTKAELLATREFALEGACVVHGPLVGETFAALEAAHARVSAELASGVVTAAGVEGSGAAAPPDDRLQDGTLVVAPPCRGCAYGPLCGRALET